MAKFNKESLTNENAFWTMFYFLKEHYDLSEGEFGLSDILSDCEPLGDGSPADTAMIEDWNDAFEKVKKQGLPAKKILNS